MFTNPNHPDSASLRDPQKVNQWRHHLCNGPWFGCYETGRYCKLYFLIYLFGKYENSASSLLK